MDIKIFTKMLNDKCFTDYEKLKHKYSNDFESFLSTLSDLYYKELPLQDFIGNKLVFIENHAAINQNAVKMLLQSQSKSYGIKAAEDGDHGFSGGGKTVAEMGLGTDPEFAGQCAETDRTPDPALLADVSESGHPETLADPADPALFHGDVHFLAVRRFPAAETV